MWLHSRLIPVVTVFFFGIIVVSDIGGANVLIDSVRAIPYGDKLGHMSLYYVLAALVNLSIKPRQRKHLRLPFGCALVLAFALLEELSQYFFPFTRMLDIQDALADCLGVYLAAWMTEKLRILMDSKTICLDRNLRLKELS
jgi:hypothetical protein